MSDQLLRNLALGLLLSSIPVMFTGRRPPSFRQVLAVAAILLPSALLFSLGHTLVCAIAVLLLAVVHAGIGIVGHQARRQQAKDTVPRP